MNSVSTEKDIATLLDGGLGRRRWTRLIGWAGGILIAVLLALVAMTVLRSKPGNTMAQYEFASVSRGNLNVSVSATGNLALLDSAAFDPPSPTTTSRRSDRACRRFA